VLPWGVITTVGHGMLDQPAFVELLRTASIDEVVDVRRFPGSRSFDACWTSSAAWYCGTTRK
jgi:hypothetical protein